MRGARPALFLLDEIFDGTNSAERRLGAEAVVRSLLDRRAIGLVTSHDLALAEIAESLAPRAANVHFEDHLEGDRIAFDYRLKPGPVRKGNALGLMRAVGLEVCTAPRRLLESPSRVTEGPHEGTAGPSVRPGHSTPDATSGGYT